MKKCCLRLPEKVRKERMLYDHGAGLLPSMKVLKRKDPQMFDLVVAFSNKPKENAEKYTGYLIKHWNFNITLVDLKWYHIDSDRLVIDNDPFTFSSASILSFQPRMQNNCLTTSVPSLPTQPRPLSTSDIRLTVKWFVETL